MSAAKVNSSQVDTRGFQHALAPLQRKHEWQLAALEAHLGRCHQAWQESRQALADLEARRRQQLAWALEKMPGRSQVFSTPSGGLAQSDRSGGAQEPARLPFDPQAHQRLLACLVRLDDDIRQAGQVVEQRLLAKQQCQAECNEKRKKIEALDEHREASLKVFVEERARVQFAQLDRDWMAHRSVKAAAQPAGTGPASLLEGVA
jgi:hypothetical protein